MRRLTLCPGTYGRTIPRTSTARCGMVTSARPIVKASSRSSVSLPAAGGVAVGEVEAALAASVTEALVLTAGAAATAPPGALCVPARAEPEASAGGASNHALAASASSAPAAVPLILDIALQTKPQRSGGNRLAANRCGASERPGGRGAPGEGAAE